MLTHTVGAEWDLLHLTNPKITSNNYRRDISRLSGQRDPLHRHITGVGNRGSANRRRPTAECCPALSPMPLSAFGHTRYNDVGEGVAPFEGEAIGLRIEPPSINLEGSTSNPAFGVRDIERHEQSQVAEVV